MSRASRVRNRKRVNHVINSPPLQILPNKSNYSYCRVDRPNPEGTIYPTPHWFSINDPGTVDVSIIVPMFRSAQEICKQIASWDAAICDGLSKEIIYIDDCCPDDSSAWVIRSWESFRSRWNGMKSICGDYNNYIGKIIKLNSNCGYAAACDVGAAYARGKYLVFLHADVLVTSNWLYPLIDTFKSNEDAGVVGNLQLREDGSIDSAGRQWCWDSVSFEDVGRDVWNGKRLDRIISVDEMLPGIEERDSVSGCCLATTKELFDKVGGFDASYRIAYWEDADLCLKIKEEGYKVYFQPQSVVYHSGHHSEASFHPFIPDNASLFFGKWLDNRKIDKFVNKRVQ